MLVVDGGPRPDPGTLTQLFFQAIERYDKPDALQVKIGGRYEPISHRLLLERVRHVANALHRMGAKAGDRVAILSENRPEWAIADYACLTSGVTDVAIYPTLPDSQVAYILNDSGAVAIFVSTREQAEKLAKIRHDLPALKHVIAFEPVEPRLADFSMTEFERHGAENEPPDAAARHRERALQVRPDDVATFLYTSGTTGEPKGVVLTHDNIYSSVASSRIGRRLCAAVPRLPTALDAIEIGAVPKTRRSRARVAASCAVASGAALSSQTIDPSAADAARNPVRTAMSGSRAAAPTAIDIPATVSRTTTPTAERSQRCRAALRRQNREPRLTEPPPGAIVRRLPGRRRRDRTWRRSWSSLILTTTDRRRDRARGGSRTDLSGSCWRCARARSR